MSRFFEAVALRRDEGNPAASAVPAASDTADDVTRHLRQRRLAMAERLENYCRERGCLLFDGEALPRAKLEQQIAHLRRRHWLQLCESLFAIGAVLAVGFACFGLLQLLYG